MAGEKLIAKALQAVRKTDPLGFYSKAAEEAQRLPQAKGTGEQMRAMLLKQGVKPEELKWTGFDDWAKGKKSVTRDEIADYLEKNRVQVGEKVLGEVNDSSTRYAGYSLPGGENYREVLLSRQGSPRPLVNQTDRGQWGFTDANGQRRDYWSREEAERAAKSVYRDSGAFKSPHWDEPDVLAHLRMADRTDPEGKKILQIEELQSDWAQAGRKQGFATKYNPEDIKEIDPANITSERRRNEFWNFQTPTGSLDVPRNERWPNIEAARQHILDNMMSTGVPTGPFVGSTPAWTDLVLKRALREAAEGGYDAMAFTPGREQAKRFNLSNHIGEIRYNDRSGAFEAYDLSGKPAIVRNGVQPNDLESLVGKEVAERVMQTPDKDGYRQLTGQNLQVGGEGMIGYYDKIVPNQLQKLVKPLDPNAALATSSMYRNPEDVAILQRGLPSLERVRDNWSSIVNDESANPAYRAQAQREFENMNRLVAQQNADLQRQMQDKMEMQTLPISAEMREKIKQGLPLFTAPAIGLGAATQMQSGENRVTDEPRGFADGGSVDQALNLLRQNFDEGGFVNSLRGMFSGPEYQSTGDKVVGNGEVNWGNPESAADFFRADKARMAMDKSPETAAPFPPRRPVEAPAPVRPVTTPSSVTLEPSILDMAFGQPVYGDKTQRFGDRSDSPAAGVDYTLGSGGDRAIFRPLPRAEPEAGAVPFAPNTGTARSSALQAIENATRPPNPNDVVNLSNNPNALPYAPSTAATPLDIRDISHLSRYRGSAMDNPEAVIFHHTADRGTPEGVINTLNTRRDPFTGRPMTLGAHYIIDRDGSIHAALPSGIRGAHIRPSKINDLSNYNTYGVEVIARDNSDITPAQIAAGQRLYSHLSAGRSNPLGIYGHGELNPGHKLPDEGLAIVNAIREAAAMRAERAGGGKAVSKALKAVSELFDSPGMAQWREGSKIPASRVEDRYFTGTSKDKDFANFNVGRHGAWFTKDPADASMYARENDSRNLRYNPDTRRYDEVNTADRVIPAFLRSENPFTGPLPDMARAENYKKAQSDWFDTLRAQGHDAWMPETDPNLAVILRDPSNIKSAISNTGEFDRTSPRVDRASGGHVLSDDYPTSYMPDVGRQVMAGGGEAEDDYQSPRSRVRAALDLVQNQMAPQADGEGFQRALQNYRNFPQQPGEATARPLNLDARDVIGGAIAGAPQRGDSSYMNEIRRRAADALVGSKGLPGSGTLGFGIADAPLVTGLPLMASDIAGSAGRGDYAEAALGAALPAAFYARQPIGKALGVARDALGRVPAPVAAGAAGAAVMSPEEAEASPASAIAKRVMRGSDLIAKDPRADDVVLSKRDLSGSDKKGMRVKDVEYVVTPKGDLQPYQRFNPEDMYRERGYVIPALGDRSAAGRNLEEIGGVKLTSPVSQQGGGEFMRSTEDPAIWASRKGPVKSMYGQLQRQMKAQGASEDAPIFMSHTLMGYPSLDSTNMMAEAILRQIQPTMGKIDPKAAAKVDTFIKGKFPDWPGILNPEEAEQFLRTNEVGKRTSTILQALDKADAVRGGLPNLGAARFATMDPRLVSADQLSSGFSISRLNPRGNGAPTEHGTYTAGMGGNYRGGTEYQIPARLMYPDWFNKMNPEYLEKKSGKMKATSPTMYQQGLLTQFPLQKTTQEWLDNIMAYTEREGKKWGYRDGGLVYE